MTDNVQVFHGEWDDEGVFFYQAYNNNIADWAIEHQKFGGPEFNPRRMTWIKPSFAWVLYRSGYGHKHGQNRILHLCTFKTPTFTCAINNSLIFVFYLTFSL